MLIAVPGSLTPLGLTLPAIAVPFHLAPGVARLYIVLVRKRCFVPEAGVERILLLCGLLHSTQRTKQARVNPLTLCTNQPSVDSPRPPALRTLVQYYCTIIGQYTTPPLNSRLDAMHHTILVITISCKGQIMAVWRGYIGSTRLVRKRCFVPEAGVERVLLLCGLLDPTQRTKQARPGVHTGALHTGDSAIT